MLLPAEERAAAIKNFQSSQLKLHQYAKVLRERGVKEETRVKIIIILQQWLDGEK